MEHSLNNPTAARPNLAEDTIVEQTIVVPKPGTNSTLNEVLSPEQSPNIPDWALGEISLIGYFDPDYQASSTMDPICDTSRQYIYRNPFAFTARLRTVSSKLETGSFARVLPFCFRNSALQWYRDELKDHERDWLLSETKVESWCKVLENHFGADGHRLPQASVTSTETAIERERKRKKPKSEREVYFDRRTGEGLTEWQSRIGKRYT